VSNLTEWLSTDQRRIEFAEEALIVEVAEQIWAAMDAAKVSKSEIAARLGKSKAFISQMLNGSRNMTLRSLADLAHSFGYRVHFSVEKQEVSDAWVPLKDAIVVQFNQRYLSPAPVDEVTNGEWTTIHGRVA
jgi:transcriptional regulator with XRE-family HTH domain